MTADPPRGHAGSDSPRVEARLTWQVADPVARVADLRERLGLQIVVGPAPDGTFVVPLDGSVLEIVPWRREAPGDEPTSGGRLVLEPVDAGSVRSGAPSGSSELPASDSILTLAGIGWGTVDLDRAAHELGPWLRDDPATNPEARMEPPGGEVASREDPHLGARTLVRATNGLPGEVIVLAEPVTEGRLAASLARHGEGPVALYLRPRVGLNAWVATARARRVTVSARRVGPLGPQVLVTGGVARDGAMAGPHLIVVGGGSPSSR